MNLWLVVESGTDVRLVEELARRSAVTVLARRIVGGVEISRSPALAVDIALGPASRGRFAAFVARRLMSAGTPPDAVLVQGYAMAALAANMLGRMRGVRIVMLVCSPVEAYYRQRRNNPLPGKPYRRLELFGLSALARLNAVVGQRYVVLSQHLREVVRSHGGTCPVDIIPVYGVDTALFRPASTSRIALKQELGLPTDGSIVFFSSRIAPEKDAETLLIAFRSLVHSGRSAWLLHRSGGFRDFLHCAERFGIADRVIASDAVHPVTELPMNYQASDLCVQASREEGLGFSPLEALACEIPVVAASVGGLRETIVDGETGWSYPVGDSAALAAAMEAALENPVEAARRAANGRLMVRERFEQSMVFDLLIEALESRAMLGRG